MAWFDVLAGVGEAAAQSTSDLQRLLLQARELEDRRRQQEAEQRRWEASERRATLAEGRAAEEMTRARKAEERTQQQFELGMRREKETNAEQQLRAYGADPIPADVIEALRTDAPNAVKNLVRKTPTGDYKLRLSPKEELDITTAARANQLLSIPEADIAKQPLAVRKQLGKLQGDENLHLTPKEQEAEVRRSPGYLIMQAQANAYAAQRSATTADDRRQANWQYTQDWNKGVALQRKEDMEMRLKLEKALDQQFGGGVEGAGRLAFERKRQQGDTAAEGTYLAIANGIRQTYGLPAAAQWYAPLVSELPLYNPPFPDDPTGKAARGMRATPGSVRGQAAQTPGGRTIVVFKEQ